MNFQPQISVAEALAQSHITFENGQPKFFSISFWKNDGSIGFIKKASRNVKEGVKGKGAKTNMKAANLMLVYDHDAKRHKHITIALMREFNMVKVFH